MRTGKRDYNPELQKRDFPADGCRRFFKEQISSRRRTRAPVIPNPVVEYTYAKETIFVASCEHGRTRAPLQEGRRSRGTLSSSDRVAAQRGQDHPGGLRGHRLEPGLWVRQTARRYNEQGLQGLGDRRHRNPGASERALLDEEGQARFREALSGPAPASVGGGCGAGLRWRFG
jgi:hypothetical protein